MNGLGAMPYVLRPMTEEDIPQVAEIEREAFPTLWPPTPFKRELRNPLARYLVAVAEGSVAPMAVPPPAGLPLLGPLVRGLQNAMGRAQPPQPKEPSELILGFVGVWFIADEAHIVSIAVQEVYRGRGLGELLVMEAIEMALRKSCRQATLEARVSNTLAQSLYEKYGFCRVGIRKGYYTDNREDAVIMTTEPIDTPQYRERFQRLVEAFQRRHGEPSVTLA